VLIGLAQTFTHFLIGSAIAGVGMSVYYAVDLALVAAVLPDPENGAKDMGIFQIANTLPQSLAPVIAPAFLAIGAVQGGNYPAVFIAASVFALVGALAIAPIKKVA
jgi:MFS family permease